MRSYLNSWILLLALMPCQLFAAKNPVIWTVTPSSGFPATHVGDQSTIMYTMTNQMPFSVLMTASERVKGGNFTVRDECKDVSVAPGGTCNIYVGHNPASAETSSYQLVYGYHKNRIPTTVFSITSDDPHTILASLITGMPNSLYLNNTPSFTVEYVNKSDSTLTSCTDSGSPLTLSGAAAATATLSSVVDNCNGTSINSGDSCTVTGKITNTTTAGALTLAGNLSCTSSAGSVSAAPQAATTVENSTGCTVHEFVVLPLPKTTYTYSDNIVQFEIDNDCSSGVSISTNVTTGDSPATTTISPSSTLTTCGSTLAANSSCLVAANIRALGTGNLTAYGLVTSGGLTHRGITSTTVNAPGYNHNVTFLNQCPFHVWIGIVNAGTNKVDPVSPSTPDDYKLSTQISGFRPSFKTVTFPNEYLGGFWGRTKCVATQSTNTFSCDTGNCTTSGYQSGQCGAAGALAPFTGLEMNFFSAPLTDGSYDGNYDVTLIGGMNIPVMMKGFGPTTTVKFPPPYNNSAFQCNSAGSPVQTFSVTGLDSCPWTFTLPGASPNRMPAKAFYFVTNDATPSTYDLTTDDNCGCASGKFCGLALGSTGSDKNKYFPACGAFRGYLTVNSLCSAVFDMSGVSGSTSPITFYNCTNNLNTQMSTPGKYLSSNIVSDLYSCNFNKAYPAILNSCFLADDNVGHNASCCGAENWSFTAQDFFANITNPDWVSPGSKLVPSPATSITWLTNGCPTAYSYPFDDHFGSFYCKQSASGNVKMDYEVVYCAAGLDAIPSSP